MPSSLIVGLFALVLLLSSTPVTPLNILTIPRSKQALAFRNGTPIIYRKALGPKPNVIDGAGALASPATGDVMIIRTPNQSNGYDKIGIGVYNSGDTMYAVRVLCHHSEPLYDQLVGRKMVSDTDVIKAIVTSALSRCVASRNAINLPSHGTDSFRLVNGEGDGLSGLCLDLYSDKLAVVMSSAAYVQLYKRPIVDAIKEILGIESVVWKTTDSRLRQDGIEEQVEEENQNLDDTADPIVIHEVRVYNPHATPTRSNPVSNLLHALKNGIKYNIQPIGSQKTGYYTDQRSNRQLLSQLSMNKRVLDLCCYVGSFSLNAAVNGGAQKCVGVDSSRDAIEQAKLNAELNSVAETCDFRVSGIEEFMKQAIEDGDEYDVIVLDPPKLAPTVKSLDRASRKYMALNRDAMKLVSSRGGILLTCTCSSAMSTKDGGQHFLNTIKRASLAAGRHVSLHQRTHAAACHTTSPLEGSSNYLTAALISVAPLA